MTDFNSVELDDLLDVELEPEYLLGAVAEVPLPFPDFNPNPLHQLSNSGLKDKHTCGRKFQINKLTRPEKIETAYFLFGTVVGLGIQLSLAGIDEPTVMMQMMVAWKLPIDDDSRIKTRQTFWHAFYAVQLFNVRIREQLFGDDWELVTINGKPACELSFRIHLPNQFYYRGYIDLVLRNKRTGEVMVVEIKTDSRKFSHEAHWKNSGQALGYAVILDYLEPNLASFRLMFLVYQTGTSEYIPYVFQKQSSQRTRWLHTLLVECGDIQNWEKEDCFPMYGESCMSFNKQCQFFDCCEFQDTALFNPVQQTKIENQIKAESYDFEIQWDQIVQKQIDRLEK